MASACRSATEPTVPITAAPAVTSAPDSERRLAFDRHDALADVGAVLHAAHHLLADEAALVEGDAVQQVEVRLVREGIAEGVVLAAFRHAERDAVGVVRCRLGRWLQRYRRRLQPRQARAAQAREGEGP